MVKTLANTYACFIGGSGGDILQENFKILNPAKAISCDLSVNIC